MPQVPYQPFGTAPLQHIATPSMRIDSPAAAFGGTVGAALEHLGGKLEQGGNELFQRAVALQQLQNETEAKEADSKYVIEAGRQHAQFSSLEGSAAGPQALEAHMKSLQDARKTIRDGLSNDMARKMYDSQSLGTMGRTIFNGAGHSATQMKSWASNTATARIKSTQDQALSTPNDDVSFQRGVQQLDTDVHDLAQLHGWSQEQTDQYRSEKLSGLHVSRIEGLARTAPFQAKKLLDEGLKNGNIRGTDVAKVTDFVNRHMYTTGARNISHEVSTGAGLDYGKGIVDIGRAADAISQFESGGRYDLRGPMVPGRGRALGKYQVMPENLPDWLKQSGLPSMTEDEFLKNHEAQDKVFNTIFGAAMKKYGNFNDAASIWFSGRPVAQAGDAKDVLGTTVPSYLANTNKFLARSAKLEDKVALGDQKAKDFAPDEPLLQDYTRNRITADHNEDLRIKRDNDFANKQTIEGALMRDKNGKLPSSLEELLIDPQAEAAWEKLDPSQQRKYMGVLENNAKGEMLGPVSESVGGMRVAMEQMKEADKVTTLARREQARVEKERKEKETFQRWNELRGMAQTDPAEFMSLSIAADQKLSIANKKSLIKLQEQLKKRAEADPRVTHALQVLGPDLEVAGIKRSADPTMYNQFVGSLQDALELETAETKSMPKADRIRQIGARLLQQQADPNAWWGKTPMYQLEVPSKDLERIKEEVKKARPEITPTDDQIQREYRRQQYQKLYGGAGAKAQGLDPSWGPVMQRAK